MKIFFPPRLIDTDDTIEDSHERMNDASERYLEGGVCIVCEESGLRDAMKVIEFAEAFDDLCHPPGM